MDAPHGFTRCKFAGLRKKRMNEDLSKIPGDDADNPKLHFDCNTTDASALAHRFNTLFSGLERAHGEYNIDQKQEDGKLTGTAVTLRQPVTDELWAQHLAGRNGIGIVPVRDDSTCLWGAIDIDQYSGLDHGRMAATVARLGFPLVTCQSKSKGCHLYLFAREPVNAGTMQDRLRDMAAKLGHGRSEERRVGKECR